MIRINLMCGVNRAAAPRIQSGRLEFAATTRTDGFSISGGERSLISDPAGFRTGVFSPPNPSTDRLQHDGAGTLPVVASAQLLALARASKDNYQQFELYSTAAELDPNCAEAFFQLGNIYASRGGDDGLTQAEQYYERAVQIDDGFVMAIDELALTKADLGKLDEALVLINRAIGLDPANMGFVEHRGIIHAKSGDLGRALDDFSTVLSGDPHNSSVLCLRRVVLERLRPAAGRFQTVMEMLACERLKVPEKSSV